MPKLSTTNTNNCTIMGTNNVTTANRRVRRSLAIKLLLGVFVVLGSVGVKAQVTVTGSANTTPAMSPTYPTLTLAIADINNRTAIAGQVTITLSAPETAPAGGYVLNNVAITGGSNSNRFILDGNGNDITAGVGTSTTTDAIFKIVGADFITLRNFGMKESAGNTTATQQIEWGVAVLYASSTNGAQNITIQSNNITLNRTNVNTFGIYSNSTHTATAPTTSASATTTAGGNSGLKIYGNSISNVNMGIVVVGPTAAADANTGIDIGGTGGVQQNSISNFGTNGTFSAYANVSGTVNGILVRNSNGFNVSFNSITSSVGGTVGGTLNGIQIPAASNAPTGTFTNTINNNNISLQSAVTAGTINGILVAATTATTTSTLDINNNNFHTSGHTVAGASGTITFINNASGAGTVATNMNGNTFTNMTVNTTGGVTFISHNTTHAANSVHNINNNSIVTAFNKTGAGGTVYFLNSFGTSPATVTETSSGNNFSNVTLTGSVTFNGWRDADGTTSSPLGPRKTVTNNTFSNINVGSGSATMLYVGFSDNTYANTNVSGNTISNITSAGTVVGFVSDGGNQNFFNNTITGITTTGASVTAIAYTGANTQNCYKNTVCNIEANNASGAVTGIAITAGTTVNVYDNRIADIRTPSTNSANFNLVGIAATSSTTLSNINLSYNTINLSGSSSGAAFNSAGIFHSTSATATTAALSLRNNIIVNASTPSASGVAAAYVRSNGTFTNYAATSNKNLFYAGTPGPQRLIYFDGTNSSQTLGAYQGIVGLAPRDAASVSENPPYLSTACGNSNFLKVNTGINTQIESGGVNVAGITDDFENDIRQGNGGYTGTGTAPDIGADEFNGMPALPMTYVSSTAVQQTGSACASATNVQVLRMDVVTSGSLNPLTLTSLTINGNGTSNFADISNYRIYYTGTNSVFNTGTPIIAAATGLTASNIVITPSSTVTLSEGTNYFWLVYNINSTVVGPNADGEFTNVVLSTGGGTPAVTAPAGALSVNPTPGAGASSNSPVCAGATLNLTGTTDIGTTYSWTGPNGFSSNSLSPSIPAVTAAAGGTYNFTATANGCISAIATTSVVVNPIPSTVTVTPSGSTTFCNGGSVGLTASGGTVSSSSTQTLGTGTSSTSAGSTSSTLGPNPLQSFYGGTKSQIIITAAELSTLGMVNGSVINSISFNLSAVEARTLQNFTIRMQNGGPSSFASTSFVMTGFTTVRNSANYTPVSGLNTIPLDAPFTSDGTNLLIEIYSSNNDAGGTGTNTALYSTTGFASSLFFRVDNQTAATVAATTTASFAAYTQRNNMQLNFTNTMPASFTWLPVTGLTPTTGAVVTAAPTSTQTYIAKSTINGCESSSSGTLVTVNQLPTSTVSGGGTVCANAPLPNVTITLTGTAPWNLTYFDGTNSTPVTGIAASPYTISNAPAGTYTVTALSDANCTGTSFTGSATVTVNPSPTITLGASPVIPAGSTSANLSYTATTGSPDQYSINYNAAANTAGFIDVLGASLPASPITLVIPGGAAAGTYNADLTVTNSITGCSSTTPISFTVQLTTPTYTFTGPGLYTTAGNWSPSYPGTSIIAQAVIIINGSCTLNVPVTNNGTFTVNGTLFNNNTFTNNGTFDNNGTYAGTGTFNGSVFDNTGGIVSPGLSPGCTAFGAGYTNGGGTEIIELGGTTVCTQYDQLQVTGTATLSGTMDVQLFGGFVPSAGQSFTVMTATSISGTFATVNYPALSPGLFWNLSYSPTAVTLSVIAATVQNVNTGLLYPTIQSAINDPLTLNGHTLVAQPVTFNEQVTVTKSLTIRGNNAGIAGNGARLPESIVDGGGVRNGFTVTANNVVIDGFKVQACGGVDNVSDWGMHNAPGTTGVQFINNIITDNKIGVYPNGNTVIRANLFDANNRTGSAGGAGIYTESTNGLVVDQNEFKGHLINSAVVFAANAAGAHQNVNFTRNFIHNNNSSNTMVYCVAVNNSLFKENNITQPGTTAIKFAGACNNDTVSYNTLNNNGTGVKVADDGYGLGANGTIQAHYNHLATNSTAGVQIDGAGTLNATCNWYGTVFGPTIATNLGGSGSPVLGAGTKTYANWLNYGTDASPNIGVQLPAAITVTAGSNTTMANNHYRLLSNAIGCLVDNQTLTVAGTFNFGNPTALNEWAKGNDQMAGAPNDLDDYSILVPSPVVNATVTAASLGSGTIQGPGDLSNVSFEGPFFFNNNLPTSSNQGWTISNLVIKDFDLSIGAFLDGTGNTTAFNNFKIINNQIDIPVDLNGTTGGETGNAQNIGIHYSFGSNQLISGNIINVDGTGTSDGVNRSTTIVMQSNTSGGTVYDGLRITNNTVTVTGDPDPAGEAVIRGIWENGHNTDADIEISGNIFSNASPTNLAGANRQFGMWQTSSSGANKNVVYKNNEFSGWNTGISSLGGPFTANTAPDYNTGETPVLIQNNKFDKLKYDIVARKSAGSTNAGAPFAVSSNSFTNMVTGGYAIVNQGTTGTVPSVCNWYGTTNPSTIATLDSGSVYVSTILNSGADGAGTGFQPLGSCITPPVHNVTQNIYYLTIQSGVNGANNGDSITVASGTYDEQVLVNKSVSLQGIGATRPIVNFTGTVSGKPTLFDVSVDAVRIDSFHFNTDLAKLKSAIIVSGAAIDNIIISDNIVDAYGTPVAGLYGDRNAVSVNYGGPTNYRVASGGVNNITFTGNTVNGTAPLSYFRSGIATDESGGTFTGNTLQSINHDIVHRFGSNGPVTISGNNFNGGGVELSDQNAAAGTITLSGNIFNGTFAITSAPGSPILRIRNNYNSIAHVVSGNTFNAYEWAASIENMNSITLNNNTFNTASATAHAVVVNTKSISTNSNSIVQVPVGGTFTNNNFNGTGNAMTFANHDSDNDSYGTFTIGTAGNENNFASSLSSFIVFDGQTGPSSGSTFPGYTGIIGAGAGAITTMACWDQDIDIRNNRMDVGAGLQAPSAMNFAQRTTLESKLTHDPDNSCLGLLTYFLPVHNLTQNTYYLTIQAGVNAANPNDVIEAAEWLFNERVTIDRSLTLQGIDSAYTVLSGTGLAGTGNGITINSGVTDVTIQRLAVRNFAGVNGNSNAGIYAIGGNNNLTVDLVNILDNVGGSGFYANGPVNNVTLTNNTSRGHTTSARGIVIWNGLKSNITITGNHVYGNNCCGIELQDGSATGVTMSNNNVHDNGDNGIGLVGLTGPGANVVNGNTLLNNGRFGIEIKNPNGSGAPAGAGSIVVNNNNVSRTNPIGGEVRDIAGIMVIRRGVLPPNVDVPTGVQVTNNTVAGYVQPSSSDGFGIVVEGLNHTVTGNTLNGNDVGIQRQAGHTPYPGDGDQSNLADQYFGRGNSPITCGVVVTGNTFGNILANGTNTRDVGNSAGDGIVTNTTTGKSYCSIQAAIDDPLTLNGHTISASAGTYNEDVVVNKQLTIQGAGYATTTVRGPIGGGGSAFQVASPNVIIDGFTITRAGNNTTDWNNPGLNTAGVSVQGLTAFAEIRNNNIVGNRTGIDINNSNGNNIHNNIIDNNRTGLIFRNQTDNTNLQQNFITNNWTVGVLFLDASGGTNVPVQQAQNSTFNNNNISGNWYGDVQDRQSGGSLPAPGFNVKNFDCNWYGQATAPVVVSTNSTEPGYAGQIPVIYGGTSVPPGGQADIGGTASANIDFINWLTNGTDDQPATMGFQPVPGSCTGTGPVLNVNTGQTYLTIQSAINNPLTLNGHTLQVSAGTYAENVVVNKSLTINGPNAANNACAGPRVAEAVVVPGSAAISSGEIFHVAASNVTISGFTIDGDNTAITSGFTSTTAADIDAAEGVTIYENNINNLTVTNNIIKNLSYFGVTLYGASGTPTTGHTVTNNSIQDMGTYDAGSGINLWGGGVLIGSNQYAAVNNNCMSNVRIGVQTDNYYAANPGAATYQSISNNTIAARRRGIFHNLSYTNASAFTVGTNNITGVANVNETASWDGMLVSSMGIGINATISNNTINGAAITAIPTTGIVAWNDQQAPLISGGTITGVRLGINVNNFEGYPSSGSNAGNTSATIDGVTVTGATIAGIRVNDNPSNTNGATVSAEIRNVNVSGSPAGILVAGSDATANVHDNTASITGNTVGVDINGGLVSPLYRNSISANGTGVRVANGGRLGLTTENFITNNTSEGIRVEATAGTIGNINNNDLSGNTGLAINNLAAPAVNATCNWYGSADGNIVFAEVSANVNYLPFLTNGTDDQPGTNGFQPVAGSCGGPGEFYVNDNNLADDLYTTAVGNDANAGTAAAPFLTIQKALLVASPGNTIYVDGGVYTTQVDINKSITIKGAGRSGTTTTRIKAPAVPAAFTNANGSYQALVYAHGAGNVINIDSVLVDGDNGRNVSNYIGVYFFEAGGSLTTSRVTAIRDAPFSGNQGGSAVYVNHTFDTNFPHSVTIDSNLIDDYQKTGLLINEINTNAIIRGNTITGQNVKNVIAQNGIQIGYGAYATITGNTITGNLWNSADPHVYMSSAILLAGAGTDMSNTATGGVTIIGGAGVLANNVNGNESGLQTGDGGFGYINNRNISYNGNSYANNKVHEYLDPSDPVNVPVVANSYDKRVDNPVQTNIVFGSIQYGVDFASAGNNLNASAGTFVENVAVHTPVLIDGVGAATIVMPEISAPDICGGASLCANSSNVFLVQAQNVTIQQLTVDGDNPALTGGINVGGANVDARIGIVTDHNFIPFTVFNNLNVNNVTVKNTYFRGIYSSTDNTFNISNNTVSNVQGEPGSVAILNFGGAGTFNGNTVTTSTDGIASNYSSGSVYSANNVTGAGIHTDNNGAFGGTADVISGNTITGADYGIIAFGAYLPVQIIENTINNSDTAITVAVNYAAVTVQVLRNEINGPSTASSVGIYQTTDAFTYSSASVAGNYQNNYVRNNGAGFLLETPAGKTSSTIANNNSITGNTLGVDTSGTGAATRNFTCNWWGVSGGNALVAAVGEATNYAPWLKSGTDGNPAIGFQPSGVCGYDDELYVNDGSNTGNFYTTAVGNDSNPGVPAAPFRTITKAIAVAQPTGSTVWVDPGNYPENLVVNKEISFKGRWAGSNVSPRFGAFVGLKASTDVESVVTAPVSDPANNPNDLVKVLSNNITFDGFTFDGNNPALAGASTVVDNLGLDIDSRRAFTNIDAANGFNPVNNLVIKNNIIQNVAQRGVSLANNGPLSTGNLIDSNLVRNFGWETGGGQGIILFTNAYADVKHNIITAPASNIGIHLQNFFSNSVPMEWSDNIVTVGADGIGIHANLFYAPAGVLNIHDNTVNAAAGVLGTTSDTWGINAWSVQVGSTVNITDNTVGNGGGVFARGINLWNLPTSNTVTVTGGSVSNSAVGIALDNVDFYFGAGATTLATVTGTTVTVGAGQTGVRARTATVNAVAPTGSATLNLNNVTINATGTAKGVEVNAPAASSPNMATVYLQGGSTLNVGNNTPVLINGDQAQLWAGASTIKVANAGAFDAIQFTNISAANTVSNLVIGGGTVVDMNGNTAARAFTSPQYAFVEMNAAGGWAVPSKITGGLQTVLIDGRVRFTSGILSTTAVADTIEFGPNAADIMTGPSPEKATSYILGRAKMLSRPVNNGAIDMLGAVLAAEAGAGANVGNLVISRTTTASGFITPFFPGGQSIRTVWNINPSNVSASRSSVRYRYLNIGTNINGQNPASIYAYRYTAGTWQKISASLSSTLVGDVYTTTSFGAPSFSPWTLSSQATAYLPDFTPSIAIGGISFPAPPLPGSTKDFVVGISEVGNAASTGQVQFLIVKSSAYTISWNTANGTSNVPGPVANNNGDWTFTNGPVFITVTLKPGVIIPAFGISRVGFTITRNAGVGSNTSTNMSVSILPGTGGDSSAGNNSTNTNLVAQ